MLSSIVRVRRGGQVSGKVSKDVTASHVALVPLGRCLSERLSWNPSMQHYYIELCLCLLMVSPSWIWRMSNFKSWGNEPRLPAQQQHQQMQRERSTYPHWETATSNSPLRQIAVAITWRCCDRNAMCCSLWRAFSKTAQCMCHIHISRRVCCYANDVNGGNPVSYLESNACREFHVCMRKAPKLSPLHRKPLNTYDWNKAQTVNQMKWIAFDTYLMYS